MKAVPKEDILRAQYREKMEERKALLRAVRSEYAKAAEEMEMLKAEILKSLRGESSFPKDILSTMVSEAEKKCSLLQEQLETAQTLYEEGQAVMASLSARYDDIISWAEMYDAASLEVKKMIVNNLIKRVEVYRGYKVHVEFNIDYQQFCSGVEPAGSVA